jgi:hypothetical protein
MLSVLKHVGIQAGPSSSMHVHVNVRSSKAPGAVVSFKNIVYVWAAYAKFQLVIDEMLSPSRPGNSYAYRLFLGDCKPKKDKEKCKQDPCGCTRRFFNQMHKFLRDHKNTPDHDISVLEFCNSVLRTPGAQQPCEVRYPHQRYFQLNLATLFRLGTIEFRAHSATYDPERIFRYVQFVMAFVEYFGSGKGRAEMEKYFSDESADVDYLKLASAQRDATARELFKKLSNSIDNKSEEYFRTRIWEKGDATCNRTANATVVIPSCHQHKEREDHGASGNNGGLWPGFSSFAEVTSQSGPEHTARARMPEIATPGSYMQITMPEGNIRAEQITQDAINQGYHEFTYSPDDQSKPW